jgi:hypothetical protein
MIIGTYFFTEKNIIVSTKESMDQNIILSLFVKDSFSSLGVNKA